MGALPITIFIVCIIAAALVELLYRILHFHKEVREILVTQAIVWGCLALLVFLALRILPYMEKLLS